MTPVQSIAMGLVLVLVDVELGGWDAVPDVLGWALVVAGLVRLRPDPVETGWLIGLSVLAGAISLPLTDRSVAESLPESTGWLLSLPEIVFSIVLAAELARVLAASRPDLAGRFRVLRWLFVVVAVGPILLFGAGVGVLLVPLAILAVGSYVYFVYQLFRSSKPVEALRSGSAA